MNELNLKELSEPVIYCITCTVNGKKYIGQATSYLERIGQHLTALRNNKHHSKAMQIDYNQFGMESFIVSTLRFVKSDENINDLESLYINSVSKGLSYNSKLIINGPFVQFDYKEMRAINTFQTITEAEKKTGIRGEYIQRLVRENKINGQNYGWFDITYDIDVKMKKFKRDALQEFEVSKSYTTQEIQEKVQHLAEVNGLEVKKHKEKGLLECIFEISRTEKMEFSVYKIVKEL